MESRSSEESCRRATHVPFCRRAIYVHFCRRTIYIYFEVCIFLPESHICACFAGEPYMYLFCRRVIYNSYTFLPESHIRTFWPKSHICTFYQESHICTCLPESHVCTCLPESHMCTFLPESRICTSAFGNSATKNTTKEEWNKECRRGIRGGTYS